LTGGQNARPTPEALLEPAHALARAVDKAQEMTRDQTLLLNMCGRGDKDIFSVMEALGM